MIAPLAKFIDWCALQAASVLLVSARKCDRANVSLAEAIEFLNGPNFIPAESKPAELEFISNIHFKFPSPRPCEFEENNVVHGRLYRGAKAWQERPLIILLHGGGNFPGHQLRFQLLARCCHRAGFNVATLELPYHFQRHIRRMEALDYLRGAEAFGQAIAEIRALTGWVLVRGCPAVALLGISLGGWLAGLAATRDSRLNAIVMAEPAVRPNYRVMCGGRILWPPVRKALERQKAAREALAKTPLNLMLSQPVIPKENILLIEGRHDLFADAEHTEALWQKWGQPEIWRLQQGHISGLFVPGLTGRALRWLAPRLEAGRKNNV
jgi:pimeloyl-ACP methyl ester carboxylesterase